MNHTIAIACGIAIPLGIIAILGMIGLCWLVCHPPSHKMLTIRGKSQPNLTLAAAPSQKPFVISATSETHYSAANTVSMPTFVNSGTGPLSNLRTVTAENVGPAQKITCVPKTQRHKPYMLTPVLNQ